MRRLVILAAAPAMIALAGCSTHEVDRHGLEKKMKSDVAGFGAHVKSVRCPADKSPKAGRTFTCAVTGEDGSTAKVEARERNDKGDVRYAIRLTRTPLLTQLVTEQVEARKHKQVGVSCPDIVPAPFDSVTCTATSGISGPIRVYPDPVGGGVLVNV